MLHYITLYLILINCNWWYFIVIIELWKILVILTIYVCGVSFDVLYVLCCIWKRIYRSEWLTIAGSSCWGLDIVVWELACIIDLHRVVGFLVEHHCYLVFILLLLNLCRLRSRVMVISPSSLLCLRLIVESLWDRYMWYQ